MKLRSWLLLGWLLPGCAATSGREWLNAPIEPRPASAELEPGAATDAPPNEARPRLRETVTLGETYEAPPEASAPVGGPAVQVNVSTQVPIYLSHPGGYGYGYGGYGYGGYGYTGYARAAAPAVRAPNAMPTKVGGDYPSPPDYGPRALR